MSEQLSNEIPNAIPTKTYVRGAFLYSTDDGTGYEEKTRNRVQDEVTIEDKANLGSLKREIQSKKEQMSKKKEKAKKEKQMLIPIRDTPVEPLPEPMNENNKCERATQEQFEYFQTYISLKEKEKKFEEEQMRRIEVFEREQERFRRNEEKEERKGMSIVLEREEKRVGLGKGVMKKKGPSIKVVIRKKEVEGGNNQEKEKKQNEQGKQKREQEQLKNNQKDKEQNQNKEQNNEQNQEQNQKYQTLSKVRVVQPQQNPQLE